MIRRGLTLIEVLAATVLFSLLVVTVVPLLNQSVRVLEELEINAVDLSELSTLADALIKDPLAYGVSFPLAQRIEVAWPDDSLAPPITVRMESTSASSDEPTHARLIFACDGWAIVRWVEMAEEMTDGGGS